MPRCLNVQAHRSHVQAHQALNRQQCWEDRDRCQRHLDLCLRRHTSTKKETLFPLPMASGRSVTANSGAGFAQRKAAQRSRKDAATVPDISAFAESRSSQALIPSSWVVHTRKRWRQGPRITRDIDRCRRPSTPKQTMKATRPQRLRRRTCMASKLTILNLIWET